MVASVFPGLRAEAVKNGAVCVVDVRVLPG